MTGPTHGPESGVEYMNLQFWQVLIVYFCAFAVTMLLVPVSIKIAEKTGGMDVPTDNRRVHTHPIPRLGGMAIFLGTMAAIIFAFAFHWLAGGKAPISPMKMGGVLIGGCLIWLEGTIDDYKNLKPAVKLIAQVGCASVVAAFGDSIQVLHNYFGTGAFDLANATSFILTVIWIVAITNTINLVDGVDGLAAGLVAIGSLCIAYVAYIFGYYPGCLCLMAVAGGALGFLPYNFYPAKTFMGDGGSQFLGFMVAALSILQPVKSTTIVALLIPALVLALPIFDTLFAIIRRKINGQPIMKADKGHIHHRLMRAGFGQRRTVLILYGMAGVMGVAAVLFSRGLYVECGGLVAVAFLFLIIVLTDRNKIRPELKDPTIVIHKEEDNK
jgi:UDP-N-acetylmuramyl pentapeptide phosphotransferase/UDP-N-acetylglucosamine-1-phosphate transferase